MNNRIIILIKYFQVPIQVFTMVISEFHYVIIPYIFNYLRNYDLKVKKYLVIVTILEN